MQSVFGLSHQRTGDMKETSSNKSKRYSKWFFFKIVFKILDGVQLTTINFYACRERDDDMNEWMNRTSVVPERARTDR
jgi:hypothetical protein